MDIGKKIIVIISLVISGIFILGFILLVASVYNDTRPTSSPVEEMYHKQLVITLDSVLDAHLNAATNKEVIDSDTITSTYHQFDKYLLPME